MMVMPGHDPGICSSVKAGVIHSGLKPGKDNIVLYAS
jgi:hypothetical protein